MTPACATGYGSLASWEQTSAVSDVAARLQDLIANLLRTTGDARTLSGRETVFEDKLRRALDELVVDEDQYPVSTAAAQLAFRLVRSLPPDLPVPDVAVDPDGEIALDWMPARTKAFSLSVGDSDRLAFAWMDGSDQAHGVVRFIGAIPKPMLMQLTELTADVGTAIGTV